ncbi:type II toxin-antitoxin system tRNA(fMet)-specific endonuclease VapC [Oryzibacter oryziterrae]|uniref:type II toxin-antitoxin system tRNA(fMet)-specific endonuclease VapC n=1 Tax=Oryzibacter oryziterrae TaxID=2766474 RepID=UPI001F195BDF|nr:type II toxin-antitoxin system VapC family toxin [Oryzibacter oryziterrae]
MRVMLDTNICIYVMRTADRRVVERFDLHAGQMAISTIVLAELEFGMRKSARPEQNLKGLELFVSGLHVLPFDAPAAQHFGQIRADLERAGTPVGTLDMLIAAHARSLGLTLVTNNRREFDRVSGLMVENWVDEAPR